MSEVVYGERQNNLGDVLCVFPGKSDWGDVGWFLGRELRAPGREPFLTTMTFFPGADSREAAMTAMREDYVYGFESQAEAEARLQREQQNRPLAGTVAVERRVSVSTPKTVARFDTRCGLASDRARQAAAQLADALGAQNLHTAQLVSLMRNLQDALHSRDAAREVAEAVHRTRTEVLLCE